MATPIEDKDETKGEASARAEAPPVQGGIKAWLPLIVSLTVMPALAYALTMYVLLPRIQKTIGVQKIEGREIGSDTAGAGARAEAPGKPKAKIALSKVIVNVSGSLGTRLLLASFTLAGDSSEFKTKVEENTDQLRDLAASALSSKTIADLEKPEARNLIRAELLSQFNTALGPNTVQEIYITEFAIQ